LMWMAEWMLQMSFGVWFKAIYIQCYKTFYVRNLRIFVIS
jgi:hypothetical protein